MGASRKPKQVEVKLNLFTKMIDLNNKAEQQVAADNIQKKPRRIVTMKSGNNQAMVQTVQKAVTHGIDALIITPRVDVAGNKYTWVGLRKGKTELQGKILLNSHIWNYLLAVLQGKELPEISEYSAESANCGQHEWLTEVEKEIIPADTVKNMSRPKTAMVILCANTSFPMEKSSCPQKR